MRVHKCLSNPANLLLILSVLTKLKLFLQCSGIYGLYRNVNFCLFLHKAISLASMRMIMMGLEFLFRIVFFPKSSACHYRLFWVLGFFFNPLPPYDSKQNLFSHFCFMVIPILYSLSG